MPNNVADAILNILTGAGVKTIYGVLGDAIFPLLDALAVSCTGSIEVFKQNNIHCSYPVDGAAWELHSQKPSEPKSLYPPGR
jgi:TPP-dependent 2-oxoacid decarboxylase